MKGEAELLGWHSQAELGNEKTRASHGVAGDGYNTKRQRVAVLASQGMAGDGYNTKRQRVAVLAAQGMARD